MKIGDLEKLAAWLRCYPVVGRESERRRLTRVVEDEIRRRQIGPEADAQSVIDTSYEAAFQEVRNVR